ncbi:uncharacterized protein LOC133559880 isoform X2 [Nerophis ophidion]|uniref:uncharacterized protein LOC133559880 isoform X2 n=1 Tax=Nerophis ophidion TaxID=159077 RepID=UPI002AE01F4E|nr:uncharacterized protein LOC133559880 isoform X2 [Nerophis ophidion]
MVWRCVICLIFVTFSLKLLLSYINRMHSRSPDFRLLCGIDGCTEEYQVYNSFFHHVKRRHSQHLVESTRPAGERPHEESQGLLQQQQNIQPEQHPQDSSISSQQLCTADTDEGQMDSNQDRGGTVQPDLTTQATAFVINARVKHRLSQKGMNDIIAGVQQYQTSLVGNLRSQLEQVLKKHSGSTSGHLQNEVTDVFDSFVDPFASVATSF